MDNAFIASQLKNLINSISDAINEIESGTAIDFHKEKIKFLSIDLHETASKIGVINSTIIKAEPAKVEPVIDTPKQEIPIVEAPIEEKEPIAEEDPIEEEEPIAEEEPIKVVEEVLVKKIEPIIESFIESIAPQAPAAIVEKPQAIIKSQLEKTNNFGGNNVDEIGIETLNQRLSKKVVQPIQIADKHKGTAIPDISKAIAISKKFEFINTLFDGNSDAYKSCLQTVQNSNNCETAINYLENNVVGTYDWHSHEKLSEEFFSLVYRRFLN